MIVYRLTGGLMFGSRRIDDLPNAVAYVRRIEQREAYRKAMEIAGPHARGGAAALGFVAVRS